LVEHRSPKPGVGGSSPSWPATSSSCSKQGATIQGDGASEYGVGMVLVKKLALFFKSLKIFFDEVTLEMSKVTWPSRDEVVNSTVLVGVTTIALTVIVMLVDSIFQQILRTMF
jgi:preprotein translocase subunit SecE